MVTGLLMNLVTARTGTGYTTKPKTYAFLVSVPGERSKLRATSMATACFPRLRACFVGLTLLFITSKAWSEYPGKPPEAWSLKMADSSICVSNEAVSLRWERGSDGWSMSSLTDVQGEVVLPLRAGFEIVRSDGKRDSSATLKQKASPSSRETTPDSAAARLGARLPGKVIETEFLAEDEALGLSWRVYLSDGANYVRQELELTALKGDLNIDRITWLQARIPGARTAGKVDGSVVVAGNCFLACEDPHARNVVRPKSTEIGRWSGGDLNINGKQAKTWDLVVGLESGTNRIVFTYENGPHRLDIWRVALLEDGKEVTVDVHHGRTGTEHVDNTYSLVLPRSRANARYQVKAEISTDLDFKLPTGQILNSNGRVELVREDTADVVCELQRKAALKAGERLAVSFVTGVAPAGQLRRGFLHYLERERAHPFRPYLHYNSWYDTAWAPFALNETNCVEAIRVMGERFIRNHGVKVDGMVFDDGWDNPSSLWQFHKGFPQGFTPLAEACRQYDTRLGVWLSPFGGYGDPRDQRLRFGREQGYEVNETGFSLAGPKYYAAFKGACVRMIRKFGVNHFKFDGIATGMYASGGGQYILDTEAMRRLMLELRREDPNLYINLTTGSWPSPFWLRYADSVWRQGGDMGFAGKGPKQQQWLTYRDQETYRNVVGKGPLYPLNSLMSQGVAYSRQGMAGDPSFSSAGFRDDVRAFFGSGTGLQELYIQPDRLTPEDWRVLAEAAKWARANADVLVDTHWIGGDPGKLEVYGYASWKSGKAVLMLRNPDDKPQDASLDIGNVFELPPGAKGSFNLRSPWSDEQDAKPFLARAGELVRFTLKPFEVRVLDAMPTDETAPKPALIPKPARMEFLAGAFHFRGDIGLRTPSGGEEQNGAVAQELRKATGLRLEPTQASSGVLTARLTPELRARLGAEGYRLRVKSDLIEIEAGEPAGVFYAGITLRQLLPPGREPGAVAACNLPCLEIEDIPRFAWRGLLVDPARHFFPVSFLRKFVDVMALHKLNTLQLHLTDDQGWRLEIQKYPRLTTVGATRKESPRHRDREQGDGVPYGPFYYTRREMRELVSYAAELHVRIVPEIEIPGHFRAALAAYPEFSCTGGPFEVRTCWGVEPDILCAGNDAALEFAKDVLDEVTRTFPCEFVHIGGDEAPRDRWKLCAKCQTRMKAEGLTQEAQLQTWLNQRLEEFLSAKDRRMIGWDEILEGGLTRKAAVMSWRGIEGGIAAANAGHDVVMSPTSHCYLDYAQSKAPEEPESIGGFVPLELVYDFDPVPPALPEEKRHHILGGQGNLWSEYLWTGADVEYFAYPRATALAEALWSPADLKHLADFEARLASHFQRLDTLFVNYRRELGTVRAAKP